MSYTPNAANLAAAMKLRRQLGYWAATAVLYLFCAGLVFDEIAAGTTPARQGWPVIWYPFAGLAVFYFMIRNASRLGIPNWHLAFLQAIFAVVYDLLLYSALKNTHAAILIGMPVIFVFCAFALRPRQTIALALVAITGLAIACGLMVGVGGASFESEVINFALTTIGIVSVTVVTGDLSKLRSRLKAQKQELEQALAKIETVARTDDLTMLANRRRMTELLDLEERYDGAEQTVCVALMDLDHFKSINDKLGHAGGDAVLKAFAETCRQVVRDEDTLARWGGEEFLLLMPGVGMQEAKVIVQRILTHVRAATFGFRDDRLAVTFSAGVVERQPAEKMGITVMRADAAMYAAKSAGRNRILLGAT
ncbi:GGDEF domain-containing protein [Massilia sp. RP-1-19]|uniref:diguanylate cyclase n=1 Tax=Massilia polaris TaxID=2728846 RepID=A0A848HL15_9BURK|nr:GGDEF domain-containing protein [Massilia polaris]NML61862.1 GGDEF domain-containing protein [Massilia polaris]